MHAASALVCVSPLIQDKNRASLHDTRTELGERSNLSPLLLEAPLGRTLDRGRGASESGLRILPNGTSGSAELGGREHLMKRSDDTRSVMKMVMISGQGDGGGKEFL
jgi:hypothetical protein